MSLNWILIEVSVSRRTTGSNTCLGIRIMKPRLRMNSPPTVQLRKLAMLMMVNRPNAIISSGFTEVSESRNTDGPGLNPPILSVARIRKTAATLPGIPRLRTGIRLAPATALFAVSVAAIPRGIPGPKFSGSLERGFAVA